VARRTVEGEPEATTPPALAAEASGPDPIDALTSESSAAPEIESLRSISETVRVDIRKLDELMNLVGELLIQRSTMGDLLAQLDYEAPGARAG
jgi:two-component system chemotaxis sensor kinase CheA